MTIDDQIRDEKLQYDINREAAKISALSSNKFNKYEYLTGEEILPSNQKQMIEQAKFTYSPLGKACEKQIKAIEDQEEKLIKTDDITKLDKKVNHDDLIYKYKNKTPNENFNTYDNALDLIDKIKNGEIKLAKAKINQIRFKSNLGKINKESNKKRSMERKKALYNIDMI